MHAPGLAQGAPGPCERRRRGLGAAHSNHHITTLAERATADAENGLRAEELHNYDNYVVSNDTNDNNFTTSELH